MVMPPGPLTFTHVYDTIVPSASEDLLPSSSTVASGTVISASLPAFATGATFGMIAACTVTFTSSLDSTPSSS